MPRPIRAAYTIPWGAQYGAIRAGGKRTHTGTDYHAPIGTPIYGTENGGRVTGRYFAAGGYGYYVTIAYPSGRTMDAHMREHSPLPVGSLVGVNTIVGYVGLTGNAVNADPPGSHDHHERWNSAGARINPEAHYATQPAGDVITPITPDSEIEDDMARAIECTTPGPDYQMIALYGGGVTGGWVEVPTTDRKGYFDLWRDVEAQQTGAGVKLVGVTQAQWNVLKSAYMATPAPAAAASNVDLSPVLTAIAGIPGSVRARIIKE